MTQTIPILMKLLRTYLFSSVLLIGACSQPPDSTANSIPDEESVVRLVSETVNRLNNALVAKDSVQLSLITSDGLRYGHSSGINQDKSTFIDDVVNGPLTFLSIESEDQEIWVHEDLASVRNRFISKAIMRGDTINIRIGTAQLYKIGSDGSCKLVLRQGYRIQ